MKRDPSPQISPPISAISSAPPSLDGYESDRSEDNLLPSSPGQETLIWVMPKVFDEMKDRVLKLEEEVEPLKILNNRLANYADSNDAQADIRQLKCQLKKVQNENHELSGRCDQMIYQFSLLIGLGVAGIGVGLVSYSSLEGFKAVMGYLASAAAGIWAFDNGYNEQTMTQRPILTLNHQIRLLNDPRPRQEMRHGFRYRQ